MSIEYMFYTATEMEPQQACKCAFDLAGFEYKIQEDAHNTVEVETKCGFNVWAKYASQSQRSLIREELNINEPSICILFRLEKFQDRELAKEKMIRIIIALFKLSLRDSILLFNHEEVLLVKQSEELQINQNSSFWDSKKLSLLDSPWKSAHLETL
jgi:hypothetical protein